MSDTPSEAFASLYNMLMSSPDDPNEWTVEQWGEFSKSIRETGKDTYVKLQSLSDEYISLREKKIELEELVRLLHDNLDKQREEMTKGDISTYREDCEDIYKSFWKELDNDSQDFLITAHYLFDRSLSLKTDFSPVILEFCRVFENELLKKIFNDFIHTQARRNRFLSYHVGVFSKIDNAINTQSQSGYYFLSSMDMVKTLSYMNNSYTNNSYEKVLQDFIRQKGFDTTKISDRSSFINPAKLYVNELRNEAAHPNYLQENRAIECKDKTKTLVGRFISAKR